jgi:putative redox protein
MSNLLAAAAARNVSIQQAKASIAGEISDAPQRYSMIEMHVSAVCDPADQLQKLVTIAERGCISANTLKSCVELKIFCD